MPKFEIGKGGTRFARKRIELLGSRERFFTPNGHLIPPTLGPTFPFEVPLPKKSIHAAKPDRM